MAKVDVKDIKDVEKTLLLPLWGRWSESIKTTGLIHDEKSIEIVELLDYDFSNMEKQQHPLTRLAWITRAWNTDLEINRFKSKDNETTVICLGCGLDTAYYRIDHQHINWIDIDLPNVIELRKRILGTSENVAMREGSILDRSIFEGIEFKGTVIVLALGLLCYFTESEVRRIFGNIASISGNPIIIMDYFSVAGVEISNKIVLSNDQNAKMIWHAESPQDILSLHPRIRLIESYPMFKKISRLLTENERAMAITSDQKSINSIAILEMI